MGVQLQHGMVPIHLEPGVRLAKLRPERRARRCKMTGVHIVYMCEDRGGSGAVIVCQKLTALAKYLSSLAGPLKQDQITVSSLYNIQSVGDGCGRTAGWAKHRYRVRPMPLDHAVEAFESLRESGVYKDAIVLGTEQCEKSKVEVHSDI